jgi:hypothetical protein
VIGESRRFFCAWLLAGIVLRLIFFLRFPAITDDSHIYANLAANWLKHGIYGQTAGGTGQIVATDARLPGYPAFLAVIFWLFGIENFKAVMLVQMVIDLATCFVVADLARRIVGNGSERAARIGFALAAVCPFLANYTSAVLTETLEIFFTAVALDCAARAMGWGEDRVERSDRAIGWAAAGAAIAACVMLRPDGGILLAAVWAYLGMRTVMDFRARSAAAPEPTRAESMRGALGASARRTAIAATIVATCALAPLVPWTIRNWRTMHHFEPLAPRYATDADELAPLGFNRWVKTWMVDYVSVEEIYWNEPGLKIDAGKLPSRAFDSPEERERTIEVIDEYNEDQDMTPELDAHFGELAADRIRAHPLRYYIMLPAARILDMWMRPRTELLPCDPRWWEFNDDRWHSAVAVGLGVMNLLYVGMAVWVILGVANARIFRRNDGTSAARAGPRGSMGDPEVRGIGLLVAFLVLRSLFLGTVESPEPRYTLEGYPVIVALAAAGLARAGKARAASSAVRSTPAAIGGNQRSTINLR